MFAHFFERLLILIGFCLRRLDSNLCVLLERFVGAGGASRKTTVMKRSEEGKANSLSTLGLSHRAHVLDRSLQNARAESKARNANGKDEFDDCQADSRSKTIGSVKPAMAVDADYQTAETDTPELHERLNLSAVVGMREAADDAIFKGSLIMKGPKLVTTRVSAMIPTQLTNTRARQDAEQLLRDAYEFSPVPRPLEFA